MAREKMMSKKLNGIVKWLIVAFAVGGFIYNTGIIHNHVKTNTKAIERIEARVETLYKFLMGEKD